MAALTGPRAQVIERWTHHMFILAAGERVFRGSAIVGDPATGRVRRPAAATAGLLHLGYSDEDVDATAGEKEVSVDLGMEIEVRWLANDGTITAADVFGLCYLLDDQTVTGTGTGNSLSGRIWAVEAARGVAVQVLRPAV